VAYTYLKYAIAVPYGQLLAFNGDLVCGLQTFLPNRIVGYSESYGKGCLLFAQDIDWASALSGKSDFPARQLSRKDIGLQPDMSKFRWHIRLPFQARALILAADAVVVGGWPEISDARDPYAAAEGRKGGVLWLLSAADGRKIAEYKLPSPPRFDGLAATEGRLFVSTVGGKLICFSTAR